MQEPIYLDHNATTPVREEVCEIIVAALRDFGNPSSDHVYGRRAKDRLETARAQVAAAIGATAAEITFTSGGTESSNLALRGALEMRGSGGEIVTSAIEHPATVEPCAWLEARGVTVKRLPVDGDGRVRMDQAAQCIGAQTTLISVMHSNNETGTLQPIEALGQLAQSHGALLHTDAAQSVGKVPVNVESLGVHLLTLAGHKLYAPKGVGALYARAGVELAPVLRGAGHERGLRPGTENVPYAAGLGEACRLALADLDQFSRSMRRLRDTLWQQLAAAVHGLVRNGHELEVLPNTLNVSFPDANGRAILAAAPEVAASTGSACHEGGALVPSAALMAMGMERSRALGAVRLSLGRSTDDAAIERAAAALIRAWQECRSTTARSGERR